MSRGSNAGMENEADPFALNPSREWLLQSLSCRNTASLSPKHRNTQPSGYPGPQSPIQASTVPHADDFNWIWVLIHAVHNVRALSSVEILAKSSKNMFILHTVYLGGPLTREMQS